MADAALIEDLLQDIGEPERTTYTKFFVAQKLTRSKLHVVTNQFLLSQIIFSAMDAVVVSEAATRILNPPVPIPPKPPQQLTRIVGTSDFAIDERAIQDCTIFDFCLAQAIPGFFAQLYSGSMVICNCPATQDMLLSQFLSESTIFVDLLPIKCKNNLYNLNVCSLEDLLYYDDFWQPNVPQTDLAMSTFLVSLYQIPKHFEANNQTLDLFLAHLQNVTPYPPLPVAIRHLMGGYLLNVEKHLISQSFFTWLRKLIPPQIVDDASVLLYAPLLLAKLINEIDANVIPQALFSTYQITLVPHVNLPKDVTDPVTLGDTVVYDRIHTTFLTKQCTRAQQQQYVGRPVSEEDIVPCILELKALLQSITPKARKLLVEQPIEYNIARINLPAVEPWKSNNLDALHSQLLVKYSLWCFKDADKSLYEQDALVVVKGQMQQNHAAYVHNEMKGAQGILKVFCPKSGESTLTANEFCSAIELENYVPAHRYFPYRSAAANAKKLPPVSLIQQVTVIALDLSASMTDPAFPNDKTASAADVAHMLIPSFVERSKAFGYTQLLGMVVFATKVKQHLQFERDTNKFLQALAQPYPDTDAGSTALYKAIVFSMDMLLTFVAQEGDKFVEKPSLRILCVTDGYDNGSRDLPPHKTVRKLQKNNIILDIIPLGSTPRILPAMARATGGLFYEFKSKQKAIELFQREAIIMVSKRRMLPLREVKTQQDLERYLTKNQFMPFEEALQLPEHPQLKAKAKSSQETPVALPRNANALDRNYKVIKEIRDINRKPVERVTVFIPEHTMFFWKVIIEGMGGTNYAGGNFLVHVTFPELYPIAAPEVRFETPIYHCNINDDGRVCHGILDAGWGAGISMCTVLEAVRDLMLEPNPDDAQDCIKAELCRTDRERYNLECQLSVAKYANKTVAQLKMEYQLA